MLTDSRDSDAVGTDRHMRDRLGSKLDKCNSRELSELMPLNHGPVNADTWVCTTLT